MKFLDIKIGSSTISLPAFSKRGDQKGHTVKLYFEICNRRMNGRDRTTFRKVPNFEKSSLNIKSGLRVDFRKSIFGSKVGNQRKKGMLT